jgi:hypothetical protein
MGETKMKTSRFAQYAAEGSKRMFLGALVKFVKGEWQEGPDRDLISPDQRFVVVMDSVTTGHFKWGGGKVIGSRMGLIADGFHPAHRNDLDDLDSATWEIDEYRNRVDPWQKTTLLVLVSADRATRSLYLHHGHGGRGERSRRPVRGACQGHRRRRTISGRDARFGLHKIKSRGRIYVPIFKIVDCVEAPEF